jgi:hypothetical protein
MMHYTGSRPPIWRPLGLLWLAAFAGAGTPIGGTVIILRLF